MSHNDHPLRQHLIALGTAFLLVLGCTAFIFYDTRPPITILSAVVEPQTARPGEHMMVKLLVDDYKACAGTVDRDVIDSYNVIHVYEKHPSHSSVRPGRVTVQIPFTLPAVMPSGETKYRSRLTFDDGCSFLAHWFPAVVYTPEITFNVVDGNDAAPK